MKSTVIECFDCKGAMQLPPSQPVAVQCPHCSATIVLRSGQQSNQPAIQPTSFTLAHRIGDVPRRDQRMQGLAILSVALVFLISATVGVSLWYMNPASGSPQVASAAELESTPAVDSVESRLEHARDEALEAVASQDLSELHPGSVSEGDEPTAEFAGVADGVGRAAAFRHSFSNYLMMYAMAESQGIPGAREQLHDALFLMTHTDEKLAERVREDVQNDRTDDLIGILAMYAAGAEFWNSYSEIETAEVDKYRLSPAARARLERTISEYRTIVSLRLADKAKLVIETSLTESKKGRP